MVMMCTTFFLSNLRFCPVPSLVHVVLGHPLNTRPRTGQITPTKMKKTYCYNTDTQYRDKTYVPLPWGQSSAVPERPLGHFGHVFNCSNMRYLPNQAGKLRQETRKGWFSTPLNASWPLWVRECRVHGWNFDAMGTLDLREVDIFSAHTLGATKTLL